MAEQDRKKPHSPPSRLFLLYKKAILAEEHPMVGSARYGCPTEEGVMAVCLGLYRQYLNISQMPNEHIKHALQVFTFLNDVGVTLNLKECEFPKECIEYLDNVICPGHLEVSTPVIEAVCRLELSARSTRLQSFLGICNVFQQVFRNFTGVGAQLNKK